MSRFMPGRTPGGASIASVDKVVLKSFGTAWFTGRVADRSGGQVSGRPASSGRGGVAEVGAKVAGGMRRTVARLDDGLSDLCGVRHFSSDDRCLLRIAELTCAWPVALSDGSRLEPGDSVADLHLWNEHIPRVPEHGPDVAWGRRLAKDMGHSMRLLARAVQEDAGLRHVQAVRAKINFAGWHESGESLSRLIVRFGFEDVDEGPLSALQRVHDAFENVLIGALVWTHNPGALRGDKLVRKRRPVWMSRRRLLDLHGRPADR